MTTYDTPRTNRLSLTIVRDALGVATEALEHTPDGRILILDPATADVRELTDTEYARAQRVRIARVFHH